MICHAEIRASYSRLTWIRPVISAVLRYTLPQTLSDRCLNDLNCRLKFNHFFPSNGTLISVTGRIEEHGNVFVTNDLLLNPARMFKLVCFSSYLPSRMLARLVCSRSKKKIMHRIDILCCFREHPVV
jgi:hypothetical protein